MAQTYPETVSQAKDWVDIHLGDRAFVATGEYRDHVVSEARGGQGFEPIEVVAIALLRIAPALERLEVPLHVRALADEIDPPPPPADTAP
jgi:hypothetical protein